MVNKEYEKLHLTKDEMKNVIDRAYNDIKKSKQGSKKLLIGVLAVKALMATQDEATLNFIWNEIIKFSDELRHKNALNDPELPNLRTLKEIQDEKQQIKDKLERLP